MLEGRNGRDRDRSQVRREEQNLSRLLSFIKIRIIGNEEQERLTFPVLVRADRTGSRPIDLRLSPPDQ